VLPATAPPKPKNPKLVAAGQAAALKRWGTPRRVRLDELTPPQRELIIALVNAHAVVNRAAAAANPAAANKKAAAPVATTDATAREEVAGVQSTRTPTS
jgi:hypothetical protein